MVLQRKIYVDDNYFPKWFKMAKNICLIEDRKSIKYYKIADIYGHKLVLYSVTRPNDYYDRRLKFVTKIIDFDKKAELISNKSENYVSLGSNKAKLE